MFGCIWIKSRAQCQFSTPAEWPGTTSKLVDASAGRKKKWVLVVLFFRFWGQTVWHVVLHDPDFTDEREGRTGNLFWATPIWETALYYNYSRLMGPESRKLPHLLLMRDCSHSTTWQTRPRSGWKNVHFDGVAWVHCGLILCAESSGKGCRL